ncbi:ribonuclease H-like domain-containing protein [Tanacetum coccineum]|uniref:Ribonuclease H-like domain-containing protein n=1 Tax=Tanacetum coccineum TaxID=301880 RepID=A0ABQ5EV00_9ASTR
MSWRQFILALGLHTAEEMETAGFGLYWADSGRQISDKGDLSAYWREISSEGDFLGTPPSYTLIRDPMLRLCHRLITCSIVGRSQAPEKVTMSNLFYLRGMDVGSVNVPYLLSKYLSLFASRRKHGGYRFWRKFVAHLAEHFGLFTKERLHGLTVIVRDLPVIDMAELLRLQIYEELNDMLEEEVHELRQSNVGLRGDVDRSITNHSGFATWMVSCMTQLMDASGRTYQAFDSTLVGRFVRSRGSDFDFPVVFSLIIALLRNKELGIERIIISTPMKNHMLIDHEYVNCPIRFDDRIRPANLLPIHMFDFDVILGMDWLASHRATIDCYARTVIFEEVVCGSFRSASYGSACPFLLVILYLRRHPYGSIKVIAITNRETTTVTESEKFSGLLAFTEVLLRVSPD